MASMVPPQYGVAYTVYVALTSQANTKLHQVNPTIAAGDWKLSKDGGALANLTTLPAVTPAGSVMLKIDLSATEMQADNATVVGIDAAGAEWCSLVIGIRTSVRRIDDLAYPTTSGRSLDVTATGAAGVDWGNVENPTTTVALTGTTAGLIDSAITAAKIAADAITAAKIADGAIDAATFAAGAINAAAIASDAITDAKVASDVTIASVTGNVSGNVVGSVASVTAGVTVTTNNDKTGYGLSAAAVQAIWDALTSALTTVGSIGKRIADNLDATISSRLATVGYTTPPTAAANADAVWDETLADHLGAGSTGNALNAAGGAGDPWATAIPGAYGAGTAGKILGDIFADTNELQTDLANGGRIDLLIDAILADTNELQTDWTNGGRLDLLIDTLITNTAAILADTGTDGIVISQATRQAIADEFLGRSVASVEATAGVYTLASLVLAAFESAIAGTVWTIKRTDGTTTFATRTVTLDAAADPITGVT